MITKTILRNATTAVFLMVTVGTLCASTIDLRIGYLYEDTAAADKIDTGMTGLFIADADGDGWAAYDSVGPDSFLADPDDAILTSFSVNGAIAGDGTHSETLNWDNTAKDVGQGDQFAVFWFNTPHTATIEVDGPGAGIEYGYYLTDDVLGASDFAYLVPNNSDSGLIQSFTASTGAGDIPDLEMAAPYVTSGVIPEPTTMFGLLMLTSGALVGSRRRRRRTNA